MPGFIDALSRDSALAFRLRLLELRLEETLFNLLRNGVVDRRRDEVQPAAHFIERQRQKLFNVVLKNEVDAFAHPARFLHRLQDRQARLFGLLRHHADRGDEPVAGIVSLRARENEIAQFAERVAAIACQHMPQIVTHAEMQEHALIFLELGLALVVDAGFFGGRKKALRRQVFAFHEGEIDAPEASFRKRAKPCAVAQDLFKLHRFGDDAPPVRGRDHFRKQALARIARERLKHFEDLPRVFLIEDELEDADERMDGAHRQGGRRREAVDPLDVFGGDFFRQFGCSFGHWGTPQFVEL
ncbi:MAG: GNAT family N-acetyltransferase [Caulobacterales bacterium]|nr:GNAT family N-acetyltransferase [Caulobacterales bacterium]